MKNLFFSFTENWSDFWCSNSNRNFQNVNDSLATDDGLTEQSWSSFLRPAWPPSPWSPSAGQIRSADEGVQSARFGNYRSLSDADNGVDGFRNSASRGNVSTRNRFFQNAAPQHPQTLAGEIPATVSNDVLLFSSIFVPTIKKLQFSEWASVRPLSFSEQHLVA